MDFDFPPDDDPRRLAIRQWIASHPDATMAETAEAGFVVPHWPQPWGIEADPMHQLIIDEEFDRAQIHRPVGIGIGWAAPTILLAGTEAQKAEYLPGSCQGRISGASSSASRMPVPIWHRCVRAPFATATPTSSTARKSGRAAVTTAATAS